MAAKGKFRAQVCFLVGGCVILQLACLNSVPIPTPSAAVETILALTGTPGSHLPSPTIQPTITRTVTPTALESIPAASSTSPTTRPAETVALQPFSTPRLQPGTPWPSEAETLSTQNLAEMVELMRFGGGRIQAVHFSWDGRLLGVETSSGRLMYAADDLSQVSASDESWENAFGPIPDELRGVKLSDGIYLEQAIDGSLQVQLVGAVETPAAFTADWQLAAGLLAPGRIGVWDAKTGELERELDTGGADPGKACTDFSGLDLSPDGTYLAAACRVSGDVYIWRLTDAVLLHTLESGREQVGSVKFSRDGRLLGTVLPENQVLLWRVRDGELLRALNDAQGARVLAEGQLAFSPDQYYLVGGFANGELLVWRLSDGALLRVLQGPAFFNQQPGEGLGFSPDGSRLLYSSWNQVLVRSAEDGELLYTLSLPESSRRQIETGNADDLRAGRSSGAIKSMSVSADGRYLAVLFDENLLQLHIYRLADGIEQEPLLLQDFPLLIRFAALNDVLAVVTTQGVYFYQLSNRSQLGWLPPAQNFDLISIAALSPDGSKIALGREGSGLQVWDWYRGEKVFEFTTGNIRGVAFSPGGTLLAICDESAIFMLQTSDWQTIGDLPIKAGILSFTPDGNLLAAVGERPEIVFVDTRTIEQSDWRLVSTARVASLGFHPLGKLLLTALDDGTLRVYGLAP